MKILIIDDETTFREDVAEVLRKRGYECETAPDGESGLEAAASFLPEVVLCDLVMPGIDGLEVLRRARTQLPETHFILITARGTLENAIEAFEQGASDYVLKPPLIDDLLQKLRRIAEHRAVAEENRRLRTLLSGDHASTEMVGSGPEMAEVRNRIEKVAEVDSSVLLLGQTGSGKEVAAREIHRLSQRGRGPFVPVNCPGIPRELVESTLFGHVQGSFTGATEHRTGLFQVAQGGTLFLDEICSMPLEAQGKILRALEEKAITRVGDSELVPVDVRVISATHRDLPREIENGEFREDLYFRVRVVEIHMPDLRERREDVPLLVQHFVDKLNLEMKRDVRGVSNPALAALMLYPWPGNVRELRNAIERAMVFRKDGFLQMEDFPPEMSLAEPEAELTDDLKTSVKAYETAHIRAILEETGGNREEAARRLGIGRATLFRKLEEMKKRGDG